ncbi:FAD-dependent oxidoreductase, partial [Streptomyces sp. URMC 123]|uniref:FAD-dependent oxidoreductase n=1 Tax=Streptomyces sp. URMC 123 TaxID=3423403 RepID=UPI003F1AF9F0
DEPADAGPAPADAGPPRTDDPARSADVLVVGAGPTGLLLAGDLAEAGHAVTLLERRPPGISNLTRAFGVHARTLEQLDARGLADELLATGRRVPGLRLFGGLVVDFSTRLRSRFPFALVTPQYEVEKLLERRARAAGVRFVHDTEVVAVRQGDDGVEVDTRPARHATDTGPRPPHPAGAPNRPTTWRAAYAGGADGVHSAVRASLGLPFPGKAVLTSMVLADVRLTEEPDSVIALNGRGGTFAFVVAFGDGWYRVGAWDHARQMPDDAPVGLDELKEMCRRALGSDLGMHDPRWLSRFHSDERQVPSYRVGRVLLAGDAAHVHSPAGGQGMNTGLQDAANLGWKLAAVLNGWAPEALLDTYHAERHPVGRTVLRSSGTLLRLAMARTPAQLAFRALAATALGHVPAVTDRAMGQVSGIGISYGAPRGAHPLTGRRVPDVRLAPEPRDSGTGSGPTRLYEALRGGRFVLIAPAGAAVDLGGRTDRVVRASWRGDRRTALLVRPDGYAAWAADWPEGDRDAAGRADALRAALAHWTGPAAVRTV